MLVLLFMATNALGWCFTIFFQWGVAVLANHFPIQVRAFQNKTGGRVIELDRVQFCNARIPTFMFGVTGFAFLLFLHQAVETPLFGYLLANFLVAVFA